jgi:ubiquinone/menaquinone biosynthesis C-methylase UbiE
MTPKLQNEVIGAWNKSAPYWDKYRGLIAQMFAPSTAALIQEAGIVSGQRVLDIGGGAGEPSLTISSIVGEQGSVMYTDPVSEMVETARKEADKRHLTNISFTQCSGDDLPFADRTFDTAVGRFSAMFFVDPAVAARQALRVVVNNGRVAFLVWGPKDANPFFSVITDAMEASAGSREGDRAVPDPFRFAAPDALATILKDAGAADVIERQLTFEIEAPITFEEFWQLRTEMSETLREKTAALAPAQLAVIKQSAADAARKYFGKGKMSFPAEALIVAGRSPQRRSTS